MKNDPYQEFVKDHQEQDALGVFLFPPKTDVQLVIELTERCKKLERALEISTLRLLEKTFGEEIFRKLMPEKKVELCGEDLGEAIKKCSPERYGIWDYQQAFQTLTEMHKQQ